MSEVVDFLRKLPKGWRGFISILFLLAFAGLGALAYYILPPAANELSSRWGPVACFVGIVVAMFILACGLMVLWSPIQGIDQDGAGSPTKTPLLREETEVDKNKDSENKSTVPATSTHSSSKKIKPPFRYPEKGVSETSLDKKRKTGGYWFPPIDVN